MMRCPALLVCFYCVQHTARLVAGWCGPALCLLLSLQGPLAQLGYEFHESVFDVEVEVRPQPSSLPT